MNTGTLIYKEAAAVQDKPRRKRRSWGLLGLFLFLVAAVTVSVCTEAVSVSLKELLGIISHGLGAGPWFAFEEQQDLVFRYIRLPRVCLGVLVGAGLAVSGASLQGLFRNPLADPGLVGISAGATLFAVLVIIFSVTFLKGINSLLGSFTLSLFAFLGSCLTAFLVYQLSRAGGGSSVTTMLLAGIAINALVLAIVGLLTALSTDDQLRNITFWNLGSLGGATWTGVLTLVPFVAVTLFFLPGLAKSLNLLSLGESQASHLGVNLRQIRIRVIVLATLSVGASVAMAGNIGFVGLLVPHMVRRAFGPDHRIVLPGSALAGAGVLVLSDTVARTIVAPSELPLGVLTALTGTPVFIYILIRERRRYD